jgi:hypothetical protein
MNPEGAFSIGIKLGRQRASFMLMDLLRNIRRLHCQTYERATTQTKTLQANPEGRVLLPIFCLPAARLASDVRI